MRRIVLLLLLALTAPSVLAQKKLFPFSSEHKKKVADYKSPALHLSAGFAPKNTVQASKLCFSAINLVDEKFGFYVSAENGMNSNYFSNTVGGTLTLHPFFYAWAGADLFTKNGFFQSRSVSGIKKELGLGITPWKKSVFTIGYSASGGFSYTAGIRVSFK